MIKLRPIIQPYALRLKETLMSNVHAPKMTLWRVMWSYAHWQCSPKIEMPMQGGCEHGKEASESSIYMDACITYQTSCQGCNAYRCPNYFLEFIIINTTTKGVPQANLKGQILVRMEMCDTNQSPKLLIRGSDNC